MFYIFIIENIDFTTGMVEDALSPYNIPSKAVTEILSSSQHNNFYLLNWPTYSGWFECW